ncbi:Hsp20/alpha crystallin family protein [Sulfurovum sp.]|jgi:HSP20 family protein|uniref:Hsp20/alpha crystallin family protein n=1 Tax=Sulfurovum sp. TaxID=1969726 RepID=UPI002A36EA16|nr:Hsp20/alpha crystallin family protein [Sulfurovum sp.]MDD2452105.1 Hsp20/alpha crystallin family protein [Sulfurovum sp.]MDD3500658.1 Hsp20/alpha crystallin family protein [Sulfurovum sp.]MDY0403513.1 Hsp20/alpha crystallin family protein [Sulfurovum sp.]
MLLTKFDPMKEFRDLEKRMGSAFKFPEVGDIANVSGFTPSVNTREGEYAYHVEVDLPGVKKDDIKVDIKDNVLTISGERKTKKEVKEKDYYKMESSYGKFQRSFTLPDNTDVENIEANSKDGVLEVVIPKLKKEGKETKQIKVK